MPVLPPKKRRPLRAWRNWHKNARPPMIRLLFSALLCALASSQATAQNWVSQTLLGLDEDQRNETFTYLLRDGNAKCDRVIRTLFNGSTVELDDWEVLCRDRNSYSLTIMPEQTAGIELVSCRALLATSKMLLEGAGSKSKATGCRIKRAEHLQRR
jgi:hypothetical protein